MAKKNQFLKEKFITFCNDKFPNDKINEQIIAGECEVTVTTVNNWADPSSTSLPKIQDINNLCRLSKVDLNYFVSEFLIIR